MSTVHNGPEYVSQEYFRRIRDPIGNAGEIPAVMNFSASVEPGQALGLVGESGCGKSTVALAVMRDLGKAGRIVGGSIRFKGRELTTMPDAELRKEYDAIKAQMGDKEYKVKHILVEKEDDAKDVIAQLQKGGKFDDLAKARSKDPGSKDRGGDLDPLDHLMAARGWKMVRYADDFILLCASEAEAREVLAAVQQWVSEAGLTLHPEKTRLVNLAAGESFEFLGWHFERGHRWPRQKSEAKLKEAVRRRTRRSSGESLGRIIARLNRVLRGWANYFRGGVRNVPQRLDQWVRMRVRSVLRDRLGRRGPATGKDHQRYPNAWLTARGLISLEAITHATAPSPAKAPL